MEWVDVTVPIRPGMAVYDGDPAVTLTLTQSIAGGGICNVGRLDFGVHTGTHIDAPVHFIEGAPGVEAIAPDALIGRALVVDATSARTDLDRAEVEALGIPAGTERVIFKTVNSELWSKERFSVDFFGLTEDAARYLVERGVRLVGIDYLSIAPASHPAPTHMALLRAGVVILEGLDLRGVPPGEAMLVCLPLLIPGADGAPARVLLSRDTVFSKL